MLKFIRGKGYQPSAERLKLQKELFAFNKTGQHGFPHRPSALAWDPELQLMAIGTRTGVIKVYGSPGVEFYGQHKSDSSVTQIFSLPNQGRFITLCDDNSLHLWEINTKDGKSFMEEVKSCSLEGRLKKISTCCLQRNGERLLIGTEGGNIYLLDVKTFEMNDNIIYQDVVMQNVSDDYRVNPGAVEAIAEHPTESNKILIGYNRGLMVLWDNESFNADHTYVGTQQLESVCWHPKGERFMSSHNDGSYITWTSSNPSKPEDGPVTPYGPFPCKAVTKLLWRTAKGDDFIIFSGGMPRASYGDYHTVSVMNGENKHVVFNFTSRIVDFFTVSDNDSESELDDPHALVVLAEEEIVVIDLLDDNWAPFKAPYLASLHSSAITCAQHFSDIPDSLWEKLQTVGDLQAKEPTSTRPWPINGGKNLAEIPKSHDLLLTGHEDGTIRFWDASGVSLMPLYKLNTSFIFANEEGNEPNQADETEDWPPFRKVGCFDPYSDDPRLAVRKIALCPYTETLIVAGTAGQVLTMSISTEEVEKDVDTAVINIVSDRDGFVWKGHDRLTLRKGPMKFAPGFKTNVVLQMHPPAAVTALSLRVDWGLLAVGTAHGFGLFDFIQNKCVVAKCTLNPNDLNGAGDTTMARRKSFKKSLRESFRRLRRGRSRRSSGDKGGREGAKTTDGNVSGSIEVRTGASSPAAGMEPKPVERAIEARAVDDVMGSMVRCLYLAKTFIVSVANQTCTLWAGTNSGAIYVFTVNMPAVDKRKEVSVACRLGKEIQLKHRAPVVAINIVDSSNTPLADHADAVRNHQKSLANVGGHRVVICSEEQFKVFTLPSLKPYGKFKLTAHEGSRIRRIGFLEFQSRSDPSHIETGVTCLTNQGDISIYSIPDLRRQLLCNCIKREDINGISSLVFARYGHGFYLHSSSEFQRFSLSASNITIPRCTLNLPEDARAPLFNTVSAVINDDIPKADDDVSGETVNELSESKEEENSRLENNISSGDITVDSVKDHISSSTEETIRITEHTEQKVEVKREETITTIETTILTSEVAVVDTSVTVESDEGLTPEPNSVVSPTSSEVRQENV
ncbi:UDP-N-acetylmuramoyl-L-alanyl-D-glutamate--2, 6-diaminopimelate ligase, variant 4 [Chamberlinius hualienensis]